MTTVTSKRQVIKETLTAALPELLKGATVRLTCPLEGRAYTKQQFYTTALELGLSLTIKEDNSGLELSQRLQPGPFKLSIIEPSEPSSSSATAEPEPDDLELSL